MNYEKFAKILSGRLDNSVKKDQRDYVKKCIREFFFERMTVKELGENIEKSFEIAGVFKDKEMREEALDNIMEAICKVKVNYDEARTQLIDERILGGEFNVLLNKLFE